MSGWSPRWVYRVVAVAEAITWALLLTGMFLKYVTETTELGVRVFGLAHGVVFIAYGLATVLLHVDQRWSLGRLLMGLLSAVVPFATIPFERDVEKRGLLGDWWRLRHDAPAGPVEKTAAGLVRRPVQGIVIGLVAVVGLTGVALLVGPPV